MEQLGTVFYYIAWVSTVLFILKMIMFSVFGGDTEVSSDFTGSVETETAFDFFSIQSILAFLMGTGWMGLACLKQFELGTFLSILVAVIFGVGMMFFSAWLMLCIKKLNHKVSRDYSKCKGVIGQAYTAFDPHSRGQIQIDFDGKLSVEEAFNDNDYKINSFSKVRVIKYENGLMYIEQE